MERYIINLADHLISKNRYDEVLRGVVDLDEFVRQIKFDLGSGDVQAMSLDTLVRVMCSFENGDVMANKGQIFNKIHVSGNCEKMLREFVSLCLAYVIKNRLTDDCYEISNWNERAPEFQMTKK